MRAQSPARVAARARRALARMARPSGEFDASRYFRGTHDLGFYNVGTSRVRRMAREMYRTYRDTWSVAEAQACADALVRDRYLEVKGVGIELMACYRRVFTPQLLPAWKRWLAKDYSSNWATTDAVCGSLIGPLLVQHPELVKPVHAWARDRNMWVRRAAPVSLIPSVRKGLALDVAYDVARMLHPDKEDLIQKAVGWMLREAGKADPRRLERYLRANGPRIPRTTVRYAIERFDETKRQKLLKATAAPAAMPKPRHVTAVRHQDMGAEATCKATFNGKTVTGTARLETDVLQFRGGDLKLSIPFKSMKKVAARGEALTIRCPDGTVSLHLGAAAAKWAHKILHPPSRLDKLGVKPEWKAAAIGVSDRPFLQELERTIASLTIDRVVKDCDAIFFGATDAAELGRLTTLKAALKPNGAIWVVRPKGRPEISEQAVMAAGKAAGLVDVKVVSFSATDTAEKFVIPLKARARQANFRVIV